MQEEHPIEKLEKLLSQMGLCPLARQNLVNALGKILKDGGMFTLTQVNLDLIEMGQPKIKEEILEAFLEVLTTVFKYSVNSHTLH